MVYVKTHDSGGEVLGFVAEARPNSTFSSPPVYCIYYASDGRILSAPIHSCIVIKERTASLESGDIIAPDNGESRG